MKIKLVSTKLLENFGPGWEKGLIRMFIYAIVLHCYSYFEVFETRGGGHGFSVSILLLFLSSLCYYKLVLNMDPCQPCYSVAVLPWPKN